MEAEKLLPCPWCNGPASGPWRDTDEDGDWYVDCKDCFAQGPLTEKAEAVAAWNRRARPSGWISVTEELPDFDVPVWLWEPGRGAWIGERADDADGWLWGNCYGSEYWHEGWKSGENMADDDYQPTRWQSLPAPPAGTPEGESDG